MIREYLNKSLTYILVSIFAAYMMVVIIASLVLGVVLASPLLFLIWLKRQVMGPRDYWTGWFAWKPVVVGKRIIWGRMLDRKAVKDKHGLLTEVEYRYPFEAIHEGTFEDVH